MPKNLSDKGELVRSELFMVVIELPDPAGWKEGEDIEALVKLVAVNAHDPESVQILQQIKIALNDGERGPPKVRFTPN